MGLGDCLKCIKNLLFVFNLIFCVIGLAVLILAIMSTYRIAIRIDDQSLFDSVRAFRVVLIVVGSIITVLGFLGCCGAFFENRVLLVLFFVVLLLIFLCLIAIGLFAVIKMDFIRKSFENQFTAGMKSENSTSTDRKFVDNIQTSLKCCGWKKGEADYTESGSAVPPSCNHNDTAPAEPCWKSLDDGFNKYGVPSIATTFVTAAVALIGLVFSMMLCCAINGGAEVL